MKRYLFSLTVLALLMSGCGGNPVQDGTTLANGKYSATGLNFNGTANVTVTVKKHRIASVQVKDDGHTYDQYKTPFTILPDSIIARQSADVDGVTGATFTSDAIRMGVNDALAQARGERAAVKADAPIAFTPGEYTGNGKGYGGNVQAKVTFTADGISDIRVTQQRETAHVGDVAFPILAPRIVEAGGLAVDGVSGATYSSHALKEAVLDAAMQAGVTNREGFIARGAKPVPGETIEDSWDIVIIGGGGAGMCAAAQAAQDGNTVLVIEKNAELGGNTLVAGGVYQSVDHSLVWDMKNPEATSAIGFDGKMHNKARATVGCVNDLKIIAGWNEAPFDAAYYREHPFVAGDVETLAHNGVHPEYLPVLLELKDEIRTYMKWADGRMADGATESQLTLFSTPNLHIFQTYYGGIRQSADGSEWVYGDVDLVRQFVLEGQKLRPWMLELGSTFTEEQSMLVGALWYRANRMTGANVNISGKDIYFDGNKGAYVMAPYAAFIGGNSHNMLLTLTTAKDLIVEDGRVTGVYAKRQNGTSVKAHARKGVIIASGGYAANIEKVIATNKYWPDRYLQSSIMSSNRASMQGDGIDMAQAVGADVTGMGWTQLMPLSYIDNGSLAFGEVDNSVFISPGSGIRFVDETSERDALCFSVFKNGLRFKGINGVYLYIVGGHALTKVQKSVADQEMRQYTVKATELGDMFKEIGLVTNPDRVLQTIRNYDMAIMDGREPDYADRQYAVNTIGRVEMNADGTYDKSTYSLEDSELMIRILAPATHHTMGGLKVDMQRHVLDTAGNPIPGLYAAGEVTGGIHGGNRLGGNALTEILVSGRIAAQAVNKDAAN